MRSKNELSPPWSPAPRGPRGFIVGNRQGLGALILPPGEGEKKGTCPDHLTTSLFPMEGSRKVARGLGLWGSRVPHSHRLSPERLGNLIYNTDVKSRPRQALLKVIS